VNERGQRNVVQSPRTVCGVVGTVLLASIMVAGSAWALLALVFYVQGLLNRSPLVLVPCLFLFLLVPVVAIGLIYLPVLITRMVFRWFGLDDRKWWRYTLSVLAVLVFVASFVLACLCGGAPSNIWARGVARYVQAHADIEGIQAWLSTLGPDDLDPEGLRHKVTNLVLQRDFANSEQPPALARLKVNRARVCADDEGHLTLRFQLGGGGFMMHWGLVVGPKHLRTPPSNLSDLGEDHFQLAPGAYIWLRE
jgi:hypothetical protein